MEKLLFSVVQPNKLNLHACSHLTQAIAELRIKLTGMPLDPSINEDLYHNIRPYESSYRKQALLNRNIESSYTHRVSQLSSPPYVLTSSLLLFCRTYHGSSVN